MSRLLFLLLLAPAACRRGADPAGPLRLGYFPNVTHAQALVGDAGGDFARAVGKPIAVRTFNAGPAAMEALLAGELDVCYVGNAPAALAYLRSGGEGLRVVAGAVSGGAALVARSATRAEELRGKRVATPQLGNSQDVALRTWLAEKQIPLSEGPEGVNVTPLANADILALFRRGQLEAAWVPEPWASRLVIEGGGHVLVDERRLWPGGRFPTTVLVASAGAIRQRRADLVALLRAHRALTERWKRSPAEFAQAANAAFGRITGHPLAKEVLAAAFANLEPEIDPMPAALAAAAAHAQALGFAPPGEVSAMVDSSLLDEASGRHRADRRSPTSGRFLSRPTFSTFVRDAIPPTRSPLHCMCLRRRPAPGRSSRRAGRALGDPSRVGRRSARLSRRLGRALP